MKNISFNYGPVDYTKLDFSLITPTGVEHAYKPLKELATPHIKVEQQYGTVHGYTITEVKPKGLLPYLTIHDYVFDAPADTSCSYYSVFSLVKNFEQNKDKHIALRKATHRMEKEIISIGNKSISVGVDVEYRIYQDRAMALVLKCTFSGAVEEEVNFLANNVVLNVYSFLSSIAYVCQGMSDFKDFKKKFIKGMSEQNKAYTLVKTDEEVQNLRQYNIEKNRTYLKNVFPINTSDLATYFLPYNNVYSLGSIAKETSDLINTFFKYESSEEESFIKEKACIYNGKISCPADIMALTCVKPSRVSLEKKRSQKAYDYVDNFIGRKNWEKMNKCTSPSYWARKNNEIVVGFTERSYDFWSNDNTTTTAKTKYLFVYNVKTKKSALYKFEVHTDYTTGKTHETAKLQVANKKLIRDDFSAMIDTEKPSWQYTSNFGNKKKERSLKYKSLPAKESIILGGLTMEELFKGTNMEYALSTEDFLNYEILNVEECTKDVYSCWSVARSVKRECPENYVEEEVVKLPLLKYVKVKDCITDPKKMGFVVWYLLRTSDNKIIEQILKSKLYNLFARDLYYAADYNKTIYEPMKITDNNSYYATNTIKYDKGQTNLTKAFGLTLEQLRYLNSKLVDSIDAVAPDGDYDYYRHYMSTENAEFTLDDIKDFLKDLNRVDMATFMEIIDLALNHRTEFKNLTNSGYNDSSLASYLDRYNLSPKGKLGFIKYYLNIDYHDLNTLRDYFRMRGQLLALKEKFPEFNINIDESTYPIKVKPATKFYHFVSRLPEEATEEDKVNEIRGFKVRIYDAVLDRSSIITRGGGIPYGEDKYDVLKAVIDFENSRNNTWYVKSLEDAVKIHLESDLQDIFDEQGNYCGVLAHLTVGGAIQYLHNELVGIYNLYQDESKQLEFENAVSRLKQFEWKDEESGLMVVAPRKVGEITNEGRTLSHCVGSYIESIINNERENIVFIRRIDMPDSPYFTMEIVGDMENKKYDIRQVHCYCNGDLSAQGQENAYANSKLSVYDKVFDITKFLEKWAKQMKNINKASVSSRYGALCHI